MLIHAKENDGDGKTAVYPYLLMIQYGLYYVFGNKLIDSTVSCQCLHWQYTITDGWQISQLTNCIIIALELVSMNQMDQSTSKLLLHSSYDRTLQSLVDQSDCDSIVSALEIIQSRLRSLWRINADCFCAVYTDVLKKLMSCCDLIVMLAILFSSALEKFSH